MASAAVATPLQSGHRHRSAVLASAPSPLPRPILMMVSERGNGFVMGSMRSASDSEVIAPFRSSPPLPLAHEQHEQRHVTHQHEAQIKRPHKRLR